MRAGHIVLLLYGRGAPQLTHERMVQPFHQPHVLVIQDLSLVGRCSSMTALPVLSCAGIHCALLPTALFSTHTGGFPNPWRHNLTQDMREILAKWSDLPLHFDGIYVGYLASDDQFAVVDAVLDRFLAPGTRLFVDPVMGDHGRRYSGCTEAMTNGFKSLCERADMIFPNPTEAAILLGRPPETADKTLENADRLLPALTGLGAAAAVLTGVEEGEFIGVGILEAGQTTAMHIMHRRFPGSYPGTGDLFASCAVAGMLKGNSAAGSCRLAADFMERILSLAGNAGMEARFGVPFEMVLPWLSQQFDERYAP